MHQLFFLFFSDPAPQVRYAKSITIDVALQTDTTQGVIYPPAIKIDYGTVSYTDAQNGQEVDVSTVLSIDTAHKIYPIIFIAPL